MVVVTECWQVCSCQFESNLAQCHWRCGDALMVRPLTPWLINQMAGGIQA